MKTKEKKDIDNALDYIMVHNAARAEQHPNAHIMFHGILGSKDWKLPTCTHESKEIARKGYEGASMTKSEFKDDPEVLKEKVKVLAGLIKASKNMVFYSGAGISTGAGVPDYASKGKPTKKLAGGYKSAEPTKAHLAAVHLFNKGHIKHWLQ